MASFNQVIKHQRLTKGKGVIGSITGAIGQKTLEKIDPRNHLINREGFLASLFSGLRGYQATGYRTPSQGAGGGRVASAINTNFNSMIERLDDIHSSEALTAKNTLSLPKIEKDISSIKKGINSLIDVIGETLPKDSAAYKRLVSDREKEFESGLDSSQIQPTSTSPDRIAPKEGGDSFFGELIKKVLIGGLGAGLFSGILAYFKNDEFKEGVNNFIGGLFGEEAKKKMTEGFDSILQSVGEIWNKHWAEISVGLVAIGTLMNPLGALSGAIGTLTNLIGLGGSLGLIGAVTGLTGAMVLLSHKSTQTDEFERQGIKNTNLDYINNRSKYDDQFRDTTLSDALKKAEEARDSYIERGMNQKLINTEQRKIDSINEQQKKLNESYMIGQQFKTNNYVNPYTQRMNELSEAGRPTPLDPLVKATTPTTPTKQGAVKGNISDFYGVTASNDPTMQPAMGSLKGANEAATGGKNEYIDFFASRGWTKEQAAGIIGNLLEESGLNPRALNKKEDAHGIAQWRNERLEHFANRYNKPITQSTLQEQLDFVDWELRNTERSAGNRLGQARSVEEATRAFDKYYERSYLGAKGQTAASRISNAQGALVGSMSINGGSPPEAVASNRPTKEGKPSSLGLPDLMGQLAQAPQGSLTSELLNKMWGKPGVRQQIEEMQNDIKSNQGENPQPVVIMPRATKQPAQQQQQLGGNIASVVDEDFIKKLVDINLTSFA